MARGRCQGADGLCRGALALWLVSPSLRSKATVKVAAQMPATTSRGSGVAMARAEKPILATPVTKREEDENPRRWALWPVAGGSCLWGPSPCVEPRPIQSGQRWTGQPQPRLRRLTGIGTGQVSPSRPYLPARNRTIGLKPRKVRARQLRPTPRPLHRSGRAVARCLLRPSGYGEQAMSRARSSMAISDPPSRKNRALVMDAYPVALELLQSHWHQGLWRWAPPTKTDD